MIRPIKIYGPCIWVLLTFVYLSVCGHAALASVYGGSSYSSCAYVNDCSSQPTTSTVPSPASTSSGSTTLHVVSGARFVVNLRNGQVIPASGYTIIISPADALSTPIAQVVISIEGHAMQTVTPDSSGTVQWFWSPKTHPGTHITVTLTDQKNQIATQDFIVLIGQPSSGSVTTAQSAAPGPAGFIEGVFVAVYKPVFYSFPYLLFAFLAINGLLLLMQERRELSELHTLQADLKRIRSVTEQKNTFIALASHYLRTPLTVILGGLDLVRSNQINPLVMQKLEETGKHLHAKVESLLDRTTSLDKLDKNSSNISVASEIKPWRHPAIFFPIILLGGVAFLFNFFAERSTALTLGQTIWIMQLFLFLCIALATFLIFRHFQLGLRDRRLAVGILKAQASVIQAQDTVIATSVTELAQDLRILEQLLPYVPSDSATYLQNGCQRFRQVLSRFAVSMKLKGGQSSQPFVAVQLHTLLMQSKVALSTNERLSAAVITTSADMTLYTHNPTLLAIVLSSLLDNALAYSMGTPTIEIACTTKRRSIVLTVSDHGKGIPQSALTNLFRPFTKVEGAEDFTHEGMGFSLYLDKLIMCYLGGDITIHSKPGTGTTVSLELPRFVP